MPVAVNDFIKLLWMRSQNDAFVFVVKLQKSLKHSEKVFKALLVITRHPSGVYPDNSETATHSSC